MSKQIARFLIIFIASVLVGCASLRQAERSSDRTMTVARILSANATVPVLFKDAEAAADIAASVRSSDEFKFALVLDKDSAALGQYIAPDYARFQEKLSSAVRQRIAKGETEFSFSEKELRVSVAPIREGERIVGYTAVGAI
jgi:sensor histidine kinase regulating citrate/malate metabolism